MGINNIQKELKEEHEWRMRLHEEIKELKYQNNTRKSRIFDVAETLLAERNQLLNRIDTINLMIVRLGYPHPDSENFESFRYSETKP